MFTLNQRVVCIDDDNQPTLQEGRMYEVREVGVRGIRVRSHTGDIRYEFANDRFAPSVAAVAPAVPEAVAPAVPEVKWVKAILILEGCAYEVKVNPDEDDQCSRIRNMFLMSAD